jgi:hypothetical protein
MEKDCEQQTPLSAAVSVDMEIRLFFGLDWASAFDFVLVWESPPTSCQKKN